jgi:type IV pilus assembly protein PilN
MLINLLPHRSAGLVQQRKAFSYKLLLAGVLALAVAVGLSFTIEQQLNSSTAVRAQLRQELAALDGQLKGMAQLETDISAARLRQSVLQNLQHDSQQPAAWLLALVLRLPEGLHLSAVRQDGRLVQVQGVARSSAQVFELLAQMDRQSPWLLGPELLDMSGAVTDRPAGSGVGLAFSIRAELRSELPSDPGLQALPKSKPAGGVP